MSDTGPIDVPVSKCEALCCKNGGRDFKPVAVVIHCPECKLKHVDQGIWATTPHKKHKCIDWTEMRVTYVDDPAKANSKLKVIISVPYKGCGYEWQPALVFTVGVEAIL